MANPVAIVEVMTLAIYPATPYDQQSSHLRSSSFIIYLQCMFFAMFLSYPCSSRSTFAPFCSNSVYSLSYAFLNILFQSIFLLTFFYCFFFYKTFILQYHPIYLTIRPVPIWLCRRVPMLH